MSTERDPKPRGGRSARSYPIGGRMADVLLGLATRLRLPALQGRHDSVLVLGAFSFVNGCLSIGVMAGAAAITEQPLVFPSLGPTAFLLFYAPTAASASPRNAVVGHLIAVLVGFGSLALFGLLGAPDVLHAGVSLPRVGAAALSLGATAALMVWLRSPHPPAGASTMIVSLGLVTAPVHLAAMMLAVVLLCCQGFVINRLAGTDYPLWSPRERPPD